ncbi:dipeptide-binding ABC transporter, periplasmic substrate-binding component [Geomicrobium sp. JCM 19055]|nr:hypothetical protein [Geomicrobium sp. JCM 19055]GAJ98119.1 dipeptide-binding ABC transporter, periplasmic substrate-binding component [Geomicrobium sp. JCM 19055]
MKKLGLLGFAGFLLLTGCNSDEQMEDTETTSSASAAITEELTVGYPAQPESLDPYISTAVATRDITRHFFETLVTVNEISKLYQCLLNQLMKVKMVRSLLSI